MIDTNKKKLLGVIGGLGPLVSAYFYEMLTRMQDVSREQDYLDMLLYSIPSTPDRTAFITSGSGSDCDTNNDTGVEAPHLSLIKAARLLAASGVDIIAIPCVTAHFFYTRIVEKTSVPVLHIVEETTKTIKEKRFIKAGVLGTDGTLGSRLFHKTLEKQGVEVIIPDTESQTALMNIIYQSTKLGKPADGSLFISIADDLRRQGAETVILGCTELSLIARDLKLHEGYTDALAVLARAALTACGVTNFKTGD